MRSGSGKSVEAPLKEADDALYRAKKAGKNRVMVSPVGVS